MKILRYIMTTLFIVMLLCFAAGASSVPEITGKAEIRTESPVGIRVIAEIDASVAKNQKTTEYGFMITRKAFLEAKGLSADDFTLDSPVAYTKGISKGVVNGTNVDIFLKKTSSKVSFSCCIHGILPYYYTESLVVRPYVIFSDRKEYGSPLEISFYEAAKGVLDDTESFAQLAPEQQEAVSAIVEDSKYVATFFANGKLHHREYVGVGKKVSALPGAPVAAEGMSFAGWSLYNDNDLDSMLEISKYPITGHTRFHAVIVTEFMEKLHRGWIQLDSIIATGLQKEVLEKIKECIGYVLGDAKRGIETDKDYVKETYTEYVDGVKKIVNKDMTKTERSQFANTITKRVDEDVREFLTHYFDIDITVK